MLNLRFSTSGELISAGGNPVLMGGAASSNPVSRDPDMLEMLTTQYAAAVRELQGQPVGVLNSPMNGDRNLLRLNEAPLGNMVTDALKWYTKVREDYCLCAYSAPYVCGICESSRTPPYPRKVHSGRGSIAYHRAPTAAPISSGCRVSRPTSPTSCFSTAVHSGQVFPRAMSAQVGQHPHLLFPCRHLCHENCCRMLNAAAGEVRLLLTTAQFPFLKAPFETRSVIFVAHC